MDETTKHLLSEWASAVTASLVYLNDLPVEQKRGIIDDLMRFKNYIGTHKEKEDTETT